MSTIEIPLCDTIYIDSRIRSANIKESDEKSFFFCLTQKFQFLWSRENRFKHKVTTLFQTFIAHLRCSFCGFQNGTLRIPITECILCNIVRIDIDAIFGPFIIKQLNGRSRLARPIGTSHNTKGWKLLFHNAF